jgi:hypothetical protein
MDYDIFEDYPTDEDEEECELGQSESEEESSSESQVDSESDNAEAGAAAASAKKPSDKDEKSDKAQPKKRKKAANVKSEVSNEEEWMTEAKALTAALPRFHQHARTLSFTSSSPIHVLQQILTPSLLDQWVVFTNEYAQKFKHTNLNITVPELLGFFSLHIYMGICRLPRIHDYWAEDYGDNFPRSTIARDRFDAILSSFCVTNPTSNDVINDPAAHSAALITHLNAIFPTLLPAPQNLAFDEAMAAYTGSDPIKQYIPSKPHPYGYKLWVLAGDDYVRKIALYGGAGADKSEKGATYDVVMQFMQGFEGKSHVLYCDSFFTSTVLFRDLLKIGVNACGSVSPNRAEVNQLKATLKAKEKTLSRGDSLHFQKPDLALTVWKDKRVMHVLYNHIHPTVPATSLRRYVGGDTRGDLPCPQAIHDYFYNARSVDVVGQLRYSYPVGRKARRAWPRLIWWLIDIAIVNAYSLYRLDHTAENQLNFRKTLMHELAAPLRKVKAAAEARAVAIRGVPLATEHYSIHSEVRGDCIVCSLQPDKRVRITYVCAGCNKHMCVGACFLRHHSNM